MALICDEHHDAHWHTIKIGEKLFAGMRGDATFCSALCAEVVERIPLDERRDSPCRPGDGGVDIHRATSLPGERGSYQSLGLKAVDLYFSISRETAERYLPYHLERYRGRRRFERALLPSR